MKYGKGIRLTLVILTITMLPSTVCYAQWLKQLVGGVVQAVGERYIDNSNYSNQDKDNMRTVLNAFSNEINSNKNAANATRDAYNGNYTGAVIQGTQAIMNATGNHNYDTYLNSANQINHANYEYRQDLQNGMDNQEALDKRNTTIGYSVAESAIELQDKIAQERAEKAKQQREAERESWLDNDYYNESINENNNRTSSSDIQNEKDCQDIFEKLWQKAIDDTKKKEDQDIFEELWQKAIDKTDNQESQDDDREIPESTSAPQQSDNNEHNNKIMTIDCDRFLALLENSNIKDKDQIVRVIRNSSNRNQEIQNMIFLYPELSDILLLLNYPSDNKVETDKEDESHNSKTLILTKDNIIKFKNDGINPIALGIDHESGKLYYNNLYNDRRFKFSCNNAKIKIKYVDYEKELSITDNCSFIIPANTFDYLDWSNVFLNISDSQQIENIKVEFIDARIEYVQYQLLSK